MLRGNVVPFSERYERRGLERGRQQGLEQGLEAVRSVHVRTAFVRFGDEVAERLAALLRPVRDLHLLKEVADIAIRARTGDELLLQVAGLREAGPGNGG
jgi:hypothetical protein